ncbi:ABC transporter substrate-binding protein [Paenibacillus aceris]|uniref:Raffinose/stachyose/melibiose transport system substrate-binding protein n=1 Tax=Paenibacillus aceris TaxID=869555 RepID=A0ABS4I5H6_9BACL|nr:extracellular solute-binding protein [Paenibacillus aceris]MBP1965975.1 raffinose/stachyose/melibiose transport system substrate-binding protein [Paenibacillus aceris]NHW35028.1 extracellular solute-binding protein [Paenibacillus aceris]
MKKTFLSVAAMMLTISVVFMGCSSRPSSGTSTTDNPAATTKPTTTTASSTPDAKPSGDKIKLTVYSTISELPNQEMMKGIAADFTKENPNVAVEFQFPGAEYENILKVKMAANDLPDVFDTHGWAIIRYGKYLADLRNEPWAKDMTDTIKPVVTDKDGKVEALVMSEAKDGISYNAEILEKYSITPPKTFDELMAAAEKIKTSSNGAVTPFFMSGVDNGMIGGFSDLYATSMFISPATNDAKTLLDGTFDWNKWTPLAQKLQDMSKKGYINKDVLTAKYSDMPQLFAQGKVAFVFGAPSFADEVYKYNKNAKIGISPLTSMVDGDSQSFSGGERYTMGAWKDGKHLAESKKLIAFFAKPENMSKIANATKLPAGLKNIESKHEFSEYYKQFENIRVFPYFDRVYLPNGMWDVMCKTGVALLAGTVSPQQFSDKMKSEYLRLRNQ